MQRPARAHAADRQRAVDRARCKVDADPGEARDRLLVDLTRGTRVTTRETRDAFGAAHLR